LLDAPTQHQLSNVTNSLKPKKRVTEMNQTLKEEHSREHSGEGKDAWIVPM
jgi:hypothetical protein